MNATKDKPETGFDHRLDPELIEALVHAPEPTAEQLADMRAREAERQRKRDEYDRMMSGGRTVRRGR